MFYHHVFIFTTGLVEMIIGERSRELQDPDIPVQKYHPFIHVHAP